MLPAGSLLLLLLCGLLPFSQGVVENVLSVARLDKGVLENVISNSLAQGNLIQGLLQGGGLGGGENGDLVGNLAGGVLGSQGGGLLGGVLGGGENGNLVGNLAEGVLGGQGGGLLGGVLGGGENGNLVGNVAGGVLGGQGGGLLGLGGEGLLGLKIVDIILPKISLKLLPGVGVELNIYAKVEVKGKTVLDGLLNLLVEVNITAAARLVQNKSGAPMLVVENCKTNLGGIQVLSGFLPLRLDNILTGLLNNLIPGVLCPVVDLVLNVLNTLLGTVNSVCPFGMLGKLHYTLAGLPLFNGEHIMLNLNLALVGPEGNSTKLPPAQLPALPLPPAVDHTSQLLISGNLLTSLLQMLVTRGAFDADITEQVLNGSVPLTTSALQSVLPEISMPVPEVLPLVVKIRITDVPPVFLHDGKATVTLLATLEVLAHTNSSLIPLFALDTNIRLKGAITITGRKLGISLFLQSVSLRVSSSQIGSFDVDVLKNWIINILRIGHLPVINGALDIGIPLPKLFNLDFAGGNVTTTENTFVVNMTPKLL